MVDWRDYHQRRKNDLDAFVKAAKTVLSRVGPPKPEPALEADRGRGRPGYSTGALLLVNLLRIKLKMSYRDLEAFLEANGELRRELGLASVPGRDTIHRHAQNLREDYLHKFNDQLTQRLKKTSAEPPSTPPVSRSKSTRDVGALPRIRNARTGAIG